jgi:RHS repeat-associated protein
VLAYPGLAPQFRSPGHLICDTTYDTIGRMMTRTDSAGTTQFVWDDQMNIVMEFAPDGTQTRYYVVNGELLMFERTPSGGSSATYQVISDHQGSVRKILDSSNTVVATYDYDSAGNLLPSSTDSVPHGGCMYRWLGGSGVRWEPATSLYYIRRRWYDPTLQRFLSCDQRRDLNRYLYAANNPATYTDTNGFIPDQQLDAYASTGGQRYGKPDPQSAKIVADQIIDSIMLLMLLGATAADAAPGLGYALLRWGGRAGAGYGTALLQLGAGAGATACACRSIGSNRGPRFDPAKLARIQQALAKEGVTWAMDEDSAAYLNHMGSEGEYWPGPDAGRPGTIVVYPNPSRAAVTEELMHLGQNRQLGFPVDLTQAQVADLEVQAQQRLLNLAAKQGWTQDEINELYKALEYWKCRQSQLRGK